MGRRGNESDQIRGKNVENLIFDDVRDSLQAKTKNTKYKIPKISQRIKEILPAREAAQAFKSSIVGCLLFCGLDILV